MNLKKEIEENIRELELERSKLEGLSKVFSYNHKKDSETNEIIIYLEQVEKENQKILKYLEQGLYFDALKLAVKEKRSHKKNFNKAFKALKTKIQNNIGSDETKTKKLYEQVNALENHRDLIENDIVEKLSKLAKQKAEKELSTRPQLLFSERSFNEACEHIRKFTHEKEVETAGVFNYKRIDKGLILYEFEKLNNIERNHRQVDTFNAEKDLSSNQEEKRITFHSHPKDGHMIISGSPSHYASDYGSGDLGELMRKGDGIEILAKPGRNEFEGQVIWAPQVLKAPNRWKKKKIKVKFLPMHIVKTGNPEKVLDQSYNQVEKYNKSLLCFCAGTNLNSPYQINPRNREILYNS